MIVEMSLLNGAQPFVPKVFDEIVKRRTRRRIVLYQDNAS